MAFEKEIDELKEKISSLRKKINELEGANIGPQASIEAKIKDSEKKKKFEKEIDECQSKIEEYKKRALSGGFASGGQGLTQGFLDFMKKENKKEIIKKKLPTEVKNDENSIKCDCGRVLSSTQKFCPVCGKLYTQRELNKKVAENAPRICPNCGFPNEAKANWCKICAYKF